jgi:protein-S-isoprenylcysteine O-methyltransferase Ste14
MGLGIVLGIAGAIMRYAISVHTTGVNIHTVGVILLVAGVVVFVLGLAAFVWGSRRRTSTVRQDVHAVPGGRELVEQREDPGSL